MSRLLKVITGLIIFFLSGTLVIFNNINGYCTFIGICLAIISVSIVLDSFYNNILEESNGNFELTVRSVSKLFFLASDSIKIHSATFAPDLYFDTRVFKNLKLAKQKGVKIEIILSEPRINPKAIKPGSSEKQYNSREFWLWVDKGEISVIQLPKKRYPHFIIVDDIHVRIEKKHKISIGGDPRKIRRRAITKYIDVDTADRYLKSFNSFKEIGKNVDYSLT